LQSDSFFTYDKAKEEVIQRNYIKNAVATE